MKLTVKERLMLLGILPKENNFVTLKIIRKLQNDLSFSEKELKVLEFKTFEKDGKLNTTWKPEKDEIKDVEIGEKAADIIKDVLKELDKQKKLTFEHFDLYEKFEVGNG